jgi:hypothetical protein
MVPRRAAAGPLTLRFIDGSRERHDEPGREVIADREVNHPVVLARSQRDQVPGVEIAVHGPTEELDLVEIIS